MNEILLAAARMVPLALVMPLGPPSVRLLLGAALASVVAAASGQAPALDASSWPPLLVREIAVGLALGLAASAVLWGAEAAGALVEGLRRASVARRSDEGGVTMLYRLLALALFGALGGPALLVDGIGRSYVALPARPGALPASSVGAVVEAGAALLLTAVELAAPVVAAVVLADLGIGLVRRSAPSLTRGVGAPGGAAVRELLSLAAVLGGSGLLVAALSSRLLPVGDALVAAARALGGGHP